MALGGTAYRAKALYEADTRNLERGSKRAQDVTRKATRSMDADLDRVGKSSQRMGSMLGTAAKVGAVAFGAALAGVGLAVRGAIKELAEAQKVTAQTNAVIKSTGGIANVTAKQVDALANSLLRKSGVDDEVIKSGANMLLTFTNVRNEAGRGNDVFNQATTTLLDMSTALGTDMSKSAIQLGKALNDPIKGVSALRRVGVTFTEEQQKLIKRLVESGNTLDAQKLILRELNKEFGGSAKAAGQTLPGQLNILRETLRNTGADIMQRFVPMLLRGIEVLRDLGGWLDRIRQAKGFTAKVQVIWEGIRDLAGTIARATVGVGAKIGQQIADEAQKAGGWLQVGRRIGDAIGNAIEFTAQQAGRIVRTLADALDRNKALLADAGASLAVALAVKLTDPVFWLEHWKELVLIGLTLFGGGLLKGIGALGAKLAPTLIAPLRTGLRALGGVFDDAVLLAARAVARLPGLLGRVAGDAVLTIGQALRALPGAAWNAFSAIPSLIGKAFAIAGVVAFTRAAIDKIREWAGDVRATLARFGTYMVDLFKKIGLRAVLVLVEPFSHLPGRFGSWARKAKDAANAQLAKIRARENLAKDGAAAGRSYGQAFQKTVAPLLRAATTFSGPKPGQTVGPSMPGLGGGGAGLQVPTSFRSTHATTGLAGFPAVDIMVAAGTRVKAPEDGWIVSVRGAAPGTKDPGINGYSLYFRGKQTGNTYYMTHLASASGHGFYRKGTVIATIAAGTAGGPHLHVGIHPGFYNPQPSKFPGGVGRGGGPTDPDADPAGRRTYVGRDGRRHLRPLSRVPTVQERRNMRSFTQLRRGFGQLRDVLQENLSPEQWAEQQTELNAISRMFARFLRDGVISNKELKQLRARLAEFRTIVESELKLDKLQDTFRDAWADGLFTDAELDAIAADAEGLGEALGAATGKAVDQIRDAKEKVSAAGERLLDALSDVFDQKVTFRVRVAVDVGLGQVEGARGELDEGGARTEFQTLVAKGGAGVNEASAAVSELVRAWEAFYTAAANADTGNVSGTAAAASQIAAAENRINQLRSQWSRNNDNGQYEAALAILDLADRLVAGAQRRGQAQVDAADTAAQQAAIPRKREFRDRVRGVLADIGPGKKYATFAEAWPIILQIGAEYGIEPGELDRIVNDPLSELSEILNGEGGLNDALRDLIGAIQTLTGLLDQPIRPRVDTSQLESALSITRELGRELAGVALAAGNQNARPPGQQVEGLARGAEVTGPRLALLGERGREWVIPESKIVPSARGAMRRLFRGILASRGPLAMAEGGSVGGRGYVPQEGDEYVTWIGGKAYVMRRIGGIWVNTGRARGYPTYASGSSGSGGGLGQLAAQAMVANRRRIFGQFGGNFFASPEAASGPSGATPSVTVNQHFTAQPEDPALYLRRAQYAAAAVYG